MHKYHFHSSSCGQWEKCFNKKSKDCLKMKNSVVSSGLFKPGLTCIEDQIVDVETDAIATLAS